MSSISNFKDSFNGGTRENRFVVNGTFPSIGSVPQPGQTNSISKFHVSATQIPTLTTMVMEYNFFGRKYYYPGEKQYGSWSLRILDDTGTNDMWKKFSNWSNFINNHETNVSQPSVRYKADWEVQQLDLNGTEPLKRFVLQGCWPKIIEPIAFNMANPNTLNQFAVVMIYDIVRIYTGENTEITETL